jgi:hypothetical protein
MLSTFENIIKDGERKGYFRVLNPNIPRQLAAGTT